jgi:aspartyl-tRNA(Asn)/glutamyl-tRNA(Gln) amidotransferase subunit A
MILVWASAAYQAGLRTRYDDYGALLRRRLVPGTLISVVDCVQALRQWRVMAQTVRQVMEGVDILLTTSSPCEAMPLAVDQSLRNLDLQPFTAPLNVTDQSAITVCADFGERGLAVSIQHDAQPFEEPLLLAVADAYEKAHGWRARRPAFTTGHAV